MADFNLVPQQDMELRAEPFVGMYNEAPPAVAVRICNKDCLPVGVDRCDTAPTPTGFAKSVGDDFPIPHAMDSASFALHTAMTK
jgi:hypothetical protein